MYKAKCFSSITNKIVHLSYDFGSSEEISQIFFWKYLEWKSNQKFMSFTLNYLINEQTRINKYGDKIFFSFVTSKLWAWWIFFLFVTWKLKKIKKAKQACSFIREFRVSTYRGRIKDGNTRYHETLAEIFRLHFPIWEKRFTLHYPEWPYFFNYTFVAGMWC